MLKSFGLFLFTLISLCPSPGYCNGHILASKIILNEYIVEGRDMTVQYSLYNIGTSMVRNVKLIDESFSSNDFELVHGLLSTSWDRIPNNANVTHTVILRPLNGGVYNISWATLSYVMNEEGHVQNGFTSAPGNYKVYQLSEFSREHSSHITEWIAFFLMSAPTILLPFFLWYSSHSKYEKMKTKKA